jgi:hypothetical protein
MRELRDDAASGACVLQGVPSFLRRLCCRGSCPVEGAQSEQAHGIAKRDARWRAAQRTAVKQRQRRRERLQRRSAAARAAILCAERASRAQGVSAEKDAPDSGSAHSAAQQRWHPVLPAAHRVPLHGQLAVRFFELVIGGGARHAAHTRNVRRMRQRCAACCKHSLMQMRMRVRTQARRSSPACRWHAPPWRAAQRRKRARASALCCVCSEARCAASGLWECCDRCCGLRRSAAAWGAARSSKKHFRESANPSADVALDSRFSPPNGRGCER